MVVNALSSQMSFGLLFFKTLVYNTNAMEQASESRAGGTAAKCPHACY